VTCQKESIHQQQKQQQKQTTSRTTIQYTKS
jgi:hypothetical protein